MGKFSYTPITDEELEAVSRATARRDRTEPRIESASFDKENGLLSLQMRNGAMIQTPIRDLTDLAVASEQELGDMKLTGNGYAIHWPSLDVQMTTVALLNLIFGIRSVTENARRAGSARTPAKAAASRANGAKGGRPRKSAAA